MTNFGVIKTYVVGRMTFPFSNYLLNRRNILAHYKMLKKTESYSEELIRELQLEKLKKIISYVNEWIPYYKSKFQEIGLLPPDIKNCEDIRQIPPLSRAEVIEHHRKMVDLRLCSSIPAADQRRGNPGTPIQFAMFRRHKLIRNTSSGSTGSPTIFYDDGTAAAVHWAHELRLKGWYGIAPGTKEARIVRLATDYVPDRWIIRLRKLFWNQLLLPGINLSDEDYETCLRYILKFKPGVLWGYTPALAGLVEYIRGQGRSLSGYRPELAIGWASPVYDHEEKVLKEVFHCKVTNIYGSREVGHVAAKCPAGSFHINDEDFIVEMDGKEGEPGQGELLVTTLYQSPMPFIRYRMGDLGEVTTSKCTCGRRLQVLSNLLGRTGEVFITKDERMISPNFWCRTFMSEKIAGSIKRFQVVYTKSGDIRIRMVRRENYSLETEAYLRKFLEKNFDSNTKIEFVYVPEIKPQVSGKYQMVTWEKESDSLSPSSGGRRS